MDRRTLLRCVSAAAVVAIAPTAIAMAAPLPVDAREVWYVCESCEKRLYEGDQAFVYYDGPAFCEAHAPTWTDLKAEQDDAIAAGEFGGWFDDDERAGACMRNTNRMAHYFPDLVVVHTL